MLDEKMKEWVLAPDSRAWADWASEFCGVASGGLAVLRHAKIGDWRVKIFCIGEREIYCLVSSVNVFEKWDSDGGEEIAEENCRQFPTYRSAQMFFTSLTKLLQENLGGIEESFPPGFYLSMASTCYGLVGVHVNEDDGREGYVEGGKTGIAVISSKDARGGLEFCRCSILGTHHHGSLFCRIAGDFSGEGWWENEVSIFYKTDKVLDDYIDLASKSRCFRGG